MSNALCITMSSFNNTDNDNSMEVVSLASSEDYYDTPRPQTGIKSNCSSKAKSPFHIKDIIIHRDQENDKNNELIEEINRPPSDERQTCTNYFALGDCNHFGDHQTDVEVIRFDELRPYEEDADEDESSTWIYYFRERDGFKLGCDLTDSTSSSQYSLDLNNSIDKNQIMKLERAPTPFPLSHVPKLSVTSTPRLPTLTEISESRYSDNSDRKKGKNKSSEKLDIKIEKKSSSVESTLKDKSSSNSTDATYDVEADVIDETVKDNFAEVFTLDKEFSFASYDSHSNNDDKKQTENRVKVLTLKFSRESIEEIELCSEKTQTKSNVNQILKIDKSTSTVHDKAVNTSFDEFWNELQISLAESESTEPIWRRLFRCFVCDRNK